MLKPPAELEDPQVGVIEARDVPDGDYAARLSGVLAVQDAEERHHRRPRRRRRTDLLGQWHSKMRKHDFKFKTRICAMCQTAMAFGVTPDFKTVLMGGCYGLCCPHC